MDKRVYCVFVLLSVICTKEAKLDAMKKQPYKAYKGRTW